MLKYILKQATHVFKPLICSFCYTQLEKQTALCDHCLELIHPIITTHIKITSRYTLEVFAVSAYEEPLRTFVLAKNYGTFLAAQQLGALMVELMPPAAFNGDLFVPIPQHWLRYAQRGFNQAELIGQALSTRLNKPLINAVQQVRSTYTQSLHKTERYVCMADAFNLYDKLEALNNKHIILVDDFMITGATLAAVAKIVSTAQPASMHAVVACRRI